MIQFFETSDVLRLINFFVGYTPNTLSKEGKSQGNWLQLIAKSQSAQKNTENTNQQKTRVALIFQCVPFRYYFASMLFKIASSWCFFVLLPKYRLYWIELAFTIWLLDKLNKMIRSNRNMLVKQALIWKSNCLWDRIMNILGI